MQCSWTAKDSWILEWKQAKNKQKPSGPSLRNPLKLCLQRVVYCSKSLLPPAPLASSESEMEEIPQRQKAKDKGASLFLGITSMFIYNVWEEREKMEDGGEFQTQREGRGNKSQLMGSRQWGGAKGALNRLHNPRGCTERTVFSAIWTIT